MRKQVAYVKQNLLVAGDAVFFVQVFDFVRVFFNKFLVDTQGDYGNLVFICLEELEQVPFGAFGNGDDSIGSFADEPENELEVQVNEFERQKFRVNKVGEVMDGDHHFSVVEQGNVAVRYMQNIRFCLINFSVWKFKLLFIAVNAADEGYLFWYELLITF